MAARRTRKKYTDSQRTSILAAAKSDGLTAAQVQSKFGVTPVTYYSWRKKSGAASNRRGAMTARPVAGVDLNTQVRSEVRTRVRAILPAIVRGEVSTYLDALFASGRGRGRKRQRA